MTSASEKLVGIAAKLYDTRRLMLSILGEAKFQEKVENFRPLFIQVERANKCGTIQAMNLILKTCDGDATKIAIVCAIAVEIMEPSLPSIRKVKP